MNKLRITLLPLTAALLMFGGIAMACGPEANMTHMGKLLNVDPAKQTFTIQDAETKNPLTFAANSEIISGLKGYNGPLMVNYEQTDTGMKAVGVTF